jgi:hypothetical protein
VSNNQVAVTTTGARQAPDGAVSALRAIGVHLTEGLNATEIARRLADANDDSARDRIALAPDALRAAALVHAQGDTLGFAEWRRAVKAHGVPLSVWEEGVRNAEAILHAQVSQREEAERRAAEAKAADAAAKAEAARLAVELAALASKRRDAGETLAGYVDSFTAPGGIAIEMEPGNMTATEPRERPDGTPARPRVRQILNAAGRVLAMVEEQGLPGAPPSMWCRVGFALRKGSPFAVDVRAEEFNAMKWIASETGMRVILSAGRDVPDLVRLALNATRCDAPTLRRYGYMGWVHEDGRWMKVHAAGAIDANGAVPEIQVRVQNSLSNYKLPPPPVGESARRALSTLAELASLTPSRAVLPCLAFVVRSLIGPGAGVCHLHGKSSVGKSHLHATLLCLAGEFDGHRSLPGSWQYDTTNHTMKALAVVGDNPYAMDDWAPGFDAGGAKFNAAARAVFNLSGRGALSRDRSFNETPAPRGSMFSNGEAQALNGSWSGLSRILAVELTEAVTLPGGRYAPSDGDANAHESFLVRAPSELGAAGAMLVQWLAPRLDQWRDPSSLSSRKLLAAAERTALRRWGVRESARAVDVLGPAALGADVLFNFLREQNAMSAAEFLLLESRFFDAFENLNSNRSETLEAQQPGRAWVGALSALLRAGICHVKEVKVNKTQNSPPPSARALGWRLRGGCWEEQGPCVGHWIDKYPNAICIDAKVALDLIRREDRRGGAVSEIQSPEHLTRELIVTDLLAARENEKRAAVRPRVDGAQVPRLAVKLEAFGIEEEALTPAPTDTPAPLPDMPPEYDF